MAKARSSALVICLMALLAAASSLRGDETPSLPDLLSRPVLVPGTPLSEVQEFCERRVPRLPDVATVAEWEALAARLRERTLREVVYRGAAAEWAARETRVEWFDVLDAAPEYRIRKLRYEAVPGLWVPALLYEPKQLSGKAPVVLNVNGHDGKGTAADYKQIRCINQAKRGMLALNVEWLGMGQLRSPDFVHYRMNQLDLCGTSGLAPFYLSMKRGLDVLLAHEHADPSRVAVAGLSGGGWQTIFISSLDERVTLANPVAGYSSFRTRARVLSDLGDSEQTPSDLATVVDYTHLTALRSPRPTLLTNNDRDRCCFAAGHALPLLLEAARPIYRLYNAADHLWVHINHVPGSHNFEQDNREALYRMFAAHFYPQGAFDPREIDCRGEVKSSEELAVPLPEGNAGFNTLAKRLAADLPPAAPPATDDERQALRKRLADVICSRNLSVAAAERHSWGKLGDAAVTALSLRIGEEWTVPAIQIAPFAPQRVVVLVCDGGRTAAADRIRALVAERAVVVALDPFYFGESRIPQRDFLYGLLVAAVGERPLGIQTDQVRAVCRFLREEHGRLPVEVHALGRRTALAALAAAALEPEAIAGLELHGSFSTLREVLEENLAVNEAPELFCFGLLATCDVPQMEGLVAPRPVRKLPLPTAPQPR
jgi:dienelactone hydrolase